MTATPPSALVLAHPGHELRLYGWLERTKPLVFVMTDGAARSQSRIPSTRAVLDATGARPGSIFGRFKDVDLYRAILSGDATSFAEATIELSDALVANAIKLVVCDAWEDYNPAHDLCRVMTALAVDRARERSGSTIAFYDYTLVGATDECVDESVLMKLDDAALERKVTAAREYYALHDEVEEQLRDGAERFRIECLRPASVDVILPGDTEKPLYESYGEARVREGRYATVLRYREHFVPFIHTLVKQLSYGGGT